MIQVVRCRVEVELDQEDIISIEEASRLSGRALTTIANLVSTGSLPWYELPPFGDIKQRVQRFTSRKAVLALPPK